MRTKGETVNDAYSQMRISGLTVDPQPEDTELALNRLETMMAELEGSRNICLNYNFVDDPDSSDLTNVTKNYWYMMSTSLAIRLIADFNKVVPQTLLALASQALASASSSVAADNIRQIAPPDRMAIGSGTTLRYNKYQRFNRETELPRADCATNVMFIDDINDFTESFTAYLAAAEVIDTFTITVDKGLTLVSSSNDDSVVSYRIQADDNTVTSGVWQQVRIVVTTSDGRRTTRLIDFEIQQNETVNNN